MAGLSAADIYSKLRGGPGGGSVSDAAQAASEAQQQHTDLDTRVRSLVGRMAGAWQGSASGAAQSGAAPVARALTQSQSELATANRAMLDQHTSFFNAYHAVVPVPDKAPESNLLNDATPWHTDLDRQIDDYNGNANKNVQIYDNYAKSADGNGRSLPSS
jgi:hypothetical protein